MSDEQFERDLRRTLARMTSEPASPALRARVGETLATPRTTRRPSWRYLPRFTAGVTAVILVVATAGLLFALRPQHAIGPAASASPGPTPAESPSATLGPAIVVPSGVPPTTWSRVPDAPEFHVGPVQGTALAVAPDGAFIAIVSSIDSGRAVVFRSTDGLTWTPSGSLPQGSHAGVFAIGVRGGTMVAVGIDTSGTNTGKATGTNRVATAAVWTSADGLAWKRVPQQPALAVGELDRLAAGPAGFLAVGSEYDAPAWSADGASWMRVDVGTPNAVVSGVAATDTGFVAVGGVETAAMAWTSPNGRTWQRATFEDSSQLNARLVSVAAQGQRLVALGAVPAPGDEAAPQMWTGLAVWASSDGGTTWKRVASGNAAPALYPPSVPKLYALTAGFIALSNLGPGGVSVWNSPDTATWRQDAIDATAHDGAFALAISRSRAVIVGSTTGGMGGDRVEFWTGDVGPPSTGAQSPWLARAGAVIKALGYDLPDGGTVSQERDMATGATNTLVRFGTAWQVQWDATGILTFVFRTAPPPSVPPVTKDIASARVISVAAAVGYAIPTHSIPTTFDAELWTATWPRTVDGVPTIGDDTGITLYADGSFAGFHRLERPLEAKPAHVLTRAEAEAAFLAARGSRPSLLPVKITGAELAWAPAAPATEPSPTLRLCWVLTLQVVGGEPGQLARAVLDAGTGVELWGDSTA